MSKILNNMSIRARMLLSIVLFLATLLYSMVAAYNSIGANVTFAQQEKKGDLIQRPLARLLHDAGKLRVALAERRGGAEVAGDIEALVVSFNKGMEDLKTATGAVGTDLQFTPEGLKSRGREGFAFDAVLKQWQDTQKAIEENPALDHDAALAATVANIRGMIAHSGDTSNLILDPDLDSYYFMDITLLAMPQTLDRLAIIGSTLYPRLAETHLLTHAERTEAAVMARMLAESDIARVIADMDTATKEDANFYGVSESFQKNTPPLLAAYATKNNALVDTLKTIGEGGTVSQAELKGVFSDAIDSAAAFLLKGFDEEDAFLDARIASYKAQQRASVMTALAGIVASLLFYLLVVRSLTGPLQALTGTMKGLASGDLSVDVPFTGVRSEIGAIAASVQVFRKNALDKIEMEKAQKAAEEQAKREHKAALRKLAQNFEDRVKGIVDAVAESATGLSATAHDMAGLIGQSAKKSKEAAEGAGQTSQNMQSVAAAADEMAVTIREISSQVQHTNTFIAESVQKAAGAEQFAVSLKDASQKVHDVTRLISAIAGQTNLLALNATIEAARAGEAGKGFAVVATEVKNLAAQTDKSIQDIEQVIGGMTQATDGVVAALAGIKASVDRIYETATGIAAAVEEQSATVNDIVKNMQIASNATCQVSENVDAVAGISVEVSHSSEKVLSAARQLNANSEQLDMEVASFLAEVRG